MLEGEVLVLELVAVDGLAPGAVARGEVTTLEKYRLNFGKYRLKNLGKILAGNLGKTPIENI